MKNSMKFTAGAVALLGVFAATACDDGITTPLIDQVLLLNAAVVAADATIEDVTLATTDFGFGAAITAADGMHGPGQPGGRHGIGGQFSGTREATFYDADGNEQDAYDPLTTASIHFIMEVEGDVSRGDWSASISRTRDMTVTGLEGEETTRTFNGFGSEEVSRSRTLDDGTEHTFSLSGTFEQSDLVVPAPGSETRWPISGTITRHMSVTVVNGPNGDVTHAVDIVITFDGDDTATAVINGETIEIDLSAREGRTPLRGGFGHNRG